MKEVLISSYLDGARGAQGLVVVIDVFRAFSVVPIFFSRGAARVFAVGDLQYIEGLKKEYPNAILVGERHGRKLDDFDYGNSPTEILNADLSGKNIIHTTSAGTQGIVAAKSAGEIVTGAFVNAAAVAKYCQSSPYEIITLVALGVSGKYFNDEDLQCAKYIKNLILGKDADFSSIRRELVLSQEAKKFLDPNIEWAPKSDLEHCLSLDIYSCICRGAVVGEQAVELTNVEIV